MFIFQIHFQETEKKPSDLAQTIPSKTVQIEPWMNEIITQRESEIPKEIKEKMKKNTKIYASVAHMLKKTNLNPDACSISYFASVISDPSFKEEYSEAVLNIAKDTHGYESVSALLCFSSLLFNPNFREDWIDKYWNPLFSQIIQNTSEGATEHAFDSLRVILSNQDFKEQYFPAVLEIAKKTSEDATHYAFDSLIYLIENPNFREDWLNPASQSYLIPEFIETANQIIQNTSQNAIYTASRSFYSFLSNQDFNEDMLSEILKIMQTNMLKPSDLACILSVYNCKAVLNEKIPAKREATVLSMLNTLKGELGIEFYERYTPKILTDVYLTATDKSHSEEKKIAFVVLNKHDQLRFFDDDPSIYEKLIDNGYCLCLCEADNENEVADRFFNYGKLKGESAISERKYNLLFISGHGQPWTINFGSSYPETSDIDLSDFGQSEKWQKGSWAKMLSDGADILSFACSTGEETDSIPVGNPGNFKNIMQMIGTLAYRQGAGIIVHAPPNSMSFIDMKFENGRVKEVVWFDNKRNKFEGKTYNLNAENKD